MKDRLLQIMKSEALTPSKFADEIGVQRSSVSHILSGRNMPGYDFITKILKRFPYVNAEWLILGSGPAFKKPEQQQLFPSEKTSQQEPGRQNENLTQPPGISPVKEEEKSVQPGTEKPLNNSKDKVLHELILLFKDKTFKRFRIYEED